MPRPDTILVERNPGETRYALLAGDDVIEVVLARDAEMQPGAVIAGRVDGFLGGDCFVDVGMGPPGVARANAKLAEGQALAVRIIVPPRADKGAKLKTADILIPEGAKIPSLLKAAPDAAAAWWKNHHDSIARVQAAPAAEARRLSALLGIDVKVGDRNSFVDVDGVIEAALEPIVPLYSGGKIIIEVTAGATVIDVDAGPSAPDIANAEAIDAVARAIRLRNLGGHILIDVIPPSGKRASIRAAATPLVDRLAALVADDPVPTEIAGITPMGMIELSRKRVGLSLAEHFTGKRRAATMAYDALRRAVRLAFTEKAARIAIDATPEVAALLRGKLKPALAEAMAQSKADIMVSERPGRAVDVVAF